MTSADTPQGLTPHGFSVQRRSHRRESPQVLSAPEDVAGRVLIAVQHQPAVGTDLGPHTAALFAACPTAGTLLRRRRRIDRCHSLPGACCLENEDGQEVAPSGVVNTLVEAGFPLGPVVVI